MRILMIRSNPVRPDSRVEKEAVSLIEGGHEVTILCWDRDSDHKVAYETIEVTGVKIPIVRIGYKAEFGAGRKSLVPFTKYQFAMIRWLIKYRKKYDAIHACDFDMACFSSVVAGVYKKKFVFDIFDFVAGEPKNLFQRLVKRMQFRIIHKADGTIICTEDRKRQIAGSKPKRLEVIHNSPFAEQMKSERSMFRKRNDRVAVVYVGILQDYRLLKEMGAFFEQHPEFEWHVGGFGKYREHFEMLSRNKENIFFYGRIPYEETLALEEECDIMLAIYDPCIENHRFAAPNKFYEALMLGKPVMMVKGTGMSEIVEREDIGCVIEYSEEGFAEGLHGLVAERSRWAELKKKMQELYREEYSWERMKRRLLKLYDDIG